MGIVVGLLVFVVAAYGSAGFDEAQKVFVLVQGVLLGAFGWLYGSQGVERAERAAVAANATRRWVERETTDVEARAARLEEEARKARELLALALTAPGVSERIKDTLERLGGEDP